jgi:glycosyltransferase A (GT-A) superfamily protein (DUF2064 family)
LFARSPRTEAIAKRAAGAEALFELAAQRVVTAAQALGIDLVVAGGRCASLPADTKQLEQRGRSFGERLQAAFGDARRLGYERVIAVGTDTPSLGTRQIRRALAALDHHPVVLGPSDDGGVYLIAAHFAIEDRFAHVRWNGRQTRADLAALADTLLLERLTDVDRTSDLHRIVPGTDRALRLTLAVIRGARMRAHAALPARFERTSDAHGIRGPPA